MEDGFSQGVIKEKEKTLKAIGQYWHAAKELGGTFLWRRGGPSDTPLLNGYTGPQLISLSSLEENLKILQKEMTL